MILKDLLTEIELKIVEGDIDVSHHHKKLEPVTGSHHVTGYTVNMPFTQVLTHSYH